MIRKLIPYASAMFVVGTVAQAALPVASLNRKTPVDFQDEILPIFRANCLACHNQTKAKADVILETPQDIAEADLVVPGKPMESFLFLTATHAEDPAMPPKDNKAGAKDLSPQQLALIKLWIEQGAKGEIRAARKIEWQPLPPGLNPIYSVAVSPDGQYAAAGRANQIFVYHIPSKTLVTRLTDSALLKDGKYKDGVSHQDLVHSLAFSPTDDLLASGGYREVKLWRRLPVSAAKSLNLGSDKGIQTVSGDGKWLAVAEGNAIKVYDLAKGSATKTLAGLKTHATSVAFSADNTKIAAGAEDGGLLTWTMADGKATAVVPPAEGEASKPVKVNAVAFLAEGKQLAAAQENNLIIVYNVTDKLEVAGEFKGHTGPVTSLAAVPTAPTQLVSGANDSTVRHWDANGFKMVRQIGAGGAVSAVAVSPDGTRIALVLTGKNARLFNAATGQLVADLKGNRQATDASAAKGRFAAYANAEFTYHTGNLKAKTDGHKKADDRAKKADEALKKAEAMPIAEKKKIFDDAEAARVADEKNYEKLKSDYEAILKTLEEHDTAAKTAEAATKTALDGAKATAIDAANKAKDATTKRTAADDAKKALDAAKTALKQGVDKFKAAGGDAAKAAAQKAVDAAKAKVTSADQAFKRADTSAKTAEHASTTAKAAADKAKAAADTATKVSADKRKLASETQKKRDDLNKQQAVAKKKFDESVKKATAAETEYKKLEEPRQQAANELKLSKEALVRAEAAKKEAEGQKAAADKQKTDADAAAKTAKDGLAQVDKPVFAVAFSADSKRVLTGGEDQLIHIWNTADGKETEVVTGHKGTINALAVTAEGGLVSGSADKTAAIWNLASEWKLERTLGTGSHDSPIVDRAAALAFSNDGKQLAVGGGEPSRSGTVHVFTVADGKNTKNLLEVHSDTVMGLQFNADGTQIASGGADKFAKISNLADGKILHSFEGHTHHVLGVAWQYNGRILASVGADNEIKVWNVVTGERAGKVTVGSKEVTSIHFVGYTDNAVVTAGDNRVRRVRVPLGNPSNVRDFSGATDYVYSCSVSADGNVIVAGGADAVLRVWNGANGQSLVTFEAPQPESSEVATKP